MEAGHPKEINSFELGMLLENQMPGLLEYAEALLGNPARQFKATAAIRLTEAPTKNDLVMMALAKEAQRQNDGGDPPGNLVSMIEATMESFFKPSRIRSH